MSKIIPSYDRGYITRKDGCQVSSVTMTINLDYPEEDTTTKPILELCNEMLEPFVGAWRIIPQVRYDKSSRRSLIRCRFFPGKPEEYENCKED